MTFPLDSGSERSRTFREHRRTHYDEYQRVKEMRLKGPFIEDESDEDNGDAKKKDGRCDSSLSLAAGVNDIEIEEGSQNISKLSGVKDIEIEEGCSDISKQCDVKDIVIEEGSSDMSKRSAQANRD